jgi:hypothetical protein
VRKYGCVWERKNQKKIFFLFTTKKMSYLPALVGLSVGNIATSAISLNAIQSVKNNTDKILSSVDSLDLNELNNIMNSLSDLSSSLEIGRAHV